MINYTQLLIGLILLSLIAIYRLLVSNAGSTNKKIINRLKSIIILSSVWAIVAFVASFESRVSTSNYWVFEGANKAFSLLALMFAISSYYFIKIFPTTKYLSKAYKLIEAGIIAISSILALMIVSGSSVTGSYLNIQSDIYNGYTFINSDYSYRSGDLAIIFGLVLVSIMIVTISLGLSKKFNKRATAKERAQSKTIVFGIASAITLGTAFQLILPSIIEDYPNSLYTIGQIAPVFITFSASYALLRHRLFDVRTSAFRALGYSLSIVTLIGVYTALIWAVILPFIYPGTELTFPSLMMVIGGTLSTILLYDKIKSVFDSLTDKLFFKNTYNLTQFLDEFNQALINNSDINDLAGAIMRVIRDNLKSEFLILMIKSKDFEIVFDSRKKKSGEVDSKLPLEMIRYYYKTGTRVVFRDYVDREKFERLYSQLNVYKASAAIDLSESSKSTTPLSEVLESGSFKTMLLGPKNDGGKYNAKDLDALKIISKELVVGLQNSMRFEEIRLFNLELQKKVESATVKLREQNKKLVLADELKDDFLSIASHQMRTPISAILGYSSILNSGDAGKMNKEQEKFSKTMEDSAKRLSYLINDFLTVSRLKSGKFTIDKAKTDLGYILRSEAKSLEGQFKAKGIASKIVVGKKIPKIKVDEQKLRQVMMNLTDNALYYTKGGGRVEISLKKEGQDIIFEVKDSGIGVPQADQEMLFTKMFRASNAEKMRPDGTGLGLYLVKKVVLGHGGQVIFRSSEGEGSVFGFIIPIHRKIPTKRLTKNPKHQELRS